MDPWQLMVLGVLGIFGGALAGIVGIGGAAIFVPALVYVAGWPIKEAVGASLAVTVFTALSGTVRGIRSEDPVDWRVFALLSSVVAPSTLAGVALSRVSPDVVVQAVFATFLLLLAYPTARGRSAGGAGGGRRIPLVLVLAAGAGIGVLAGLVGIGGAALTIPLMSLGFGLRFKVAVATSLAMNFLTGVAGAAGYLATGIVDVGSLPTLIAGAVAGAWIGVALRDRAPEKIIRRGFAAFMVLTAIRILADALGGS